MEPDPNSRLNAACSEASADERLCDCMHIGVGSIHRCTLGSSFDHPTPRNQKFSLLLAYITFVSQLSGTDFSFYLFLIYGHEFECI